MFHDDLKVTFIEDQLNIRKKNDAEKGNVKLTRERWSKEKTKIKHNCVKGVIIKVNVGKACKDLFTFISTCTHCTSLGIDNVNDGLEKNSELSCRLCEVLDRLHYLLELDIRCVDLSENGRQLLSSISHPDLRGLTLISNKLYVQGEELRAAFTRLPQLTFLQLNDSGLAGEELLCGLTQLPFSTPLLQALNVGYHDLSSGGDQLVQVVEALPALRLLNIQKCQLVSSVLCSTLEKINKNIEILDISNNGPVTDRKALIFDHIQECKFLTYMQISSSQWSPAKLSQLNFLLSANGGCLLVDPTTKHAQWEKYITHIDRIRDQCILA